MSDQGGGGGDSSSTERSSHTSSTVLLPEPGKHHGKLSSSAAPAGSLSSQGSLGSSSTWRTTPILEALARPAQLASPSLAARRLIRWKRIASDDMEKCMTEEKEDATASQPDMTTGESTAEDEDVDTEETPGGDSADSGLTGGAEREKGSGVPPLLDSEDGSARVLVPLHETCR
ncbi:uncharacterized protein [Panulirus ornatus]|uniref:uncharacterized protein n=1 Tax=Panulirus ornatus TaxID=150431 RepID=UPI003A89C36E